MAHIGIYVLILGPQLVKLVRIRRCDLIGGGDISLGTGFEASKFSAFLSLSLFSLPPPSLPPPPTSKLTDQM